MKILFGKKGSVNLVNFDYNEEVTMLRLSFYDSNLLNFEMKNGNIWLKKQK